MNKQSITPEQFRAVAGTMPACRAADALGISQRTSTDWHRAIPSAQRLSTSHGSQKRSRSPLNCALPASLIKASP